MERIADFGTDPLFLRRWSARAMNGEPLSEADLMRLFEAARWAPSSANGQPWRFVYARAATDSFERLFNLLADGNKPWCARAGALLVVLSKKTFDNGRAERTHSFDTGAAWMSLALEATLLELVVRGMEGFDYNRARADLGVPDDYDVEAMVALGYPGRVEDLPEKYQEREVKSGRREIREFAFEGKFPTT